MFSMADQWSSHGSDGVLAYAGYMHQLAEDFIDDYDVPLFWFDDTRPSGMNSWELDALYGLIKTKDSDCLILHNYAGGRGQDNGLGDLDIVSYEGDNDSNSALHVVNFDHSCAVDDSRWDMHYDIADWLEVGNRKDAIFGVVPGPITDSSWSYSVKNKTSGDLYLHLIDNSASPSHSKTGFSGGGGLARSAGGRSRPRDPH